MSNNIKQGNSLISDSTVTGNLAFDWNLEFKNILEDGGFDIILGNPPYVTSRNNTMSPKVKKYYSNNYTLQMDKPNTYLLFLERSLKLLKPKGYLGFILPNSWLGIDSATNIREYLLKNCTISSIVNLYGISFPDANVETVILIIKNEPPVKNHEMIIQNLDASDLKKGIFNPRKIKQNSWLENTNYLFDLISSDDDEKIIKKILTNSHELVKVATPKSGLQAYEVNKGIPKQTKADRENKIYHYSYKFDDNTFKYLDGKDINRYSLTWGGSWLKYGPNLSQPREFSIFSNPRILVREITGTYPYLIKAMYTEEIFLNNKSILNILPKDGGYNLYYILGYINSRLASFYLQRKSVKSNRTLFPKITLGDLERLPIPQAKTYIQDSIQQYVKNILIIEELLHTTKNTFIDFLQIECNFNLTTKLKDFIINSETEFISEIRKKNKSYSIATDENDVLKHFRIFKEKVHELNMQSLDIEDKINTVFYELINLTQDEISTINFYTI